MSIQTPTTKHVQEHWDAILRGLLLGISLIAVKTADRPALWTDEQITLELIRRWTPGELLTVLPLLQPHYPTYYFLPEFAGWDATLTVSLLSLPITVLATVEAARSLGRSNHQAYIAGLLIAVSPYLATQAGWLRMYAPLTALLTIGLWLGLDGRYRTATPVMLFAGLLHVFGYFGVLWLALAAFVGHDRVAGVVTLVLGSVPPVALLALNSSSKGITTETTGMGHGIAPSLLELSLTPLSSLVGGPHHLPEVVAVLVLTVLILHPRGDWRLMWWILLPVAGITVASYLVHPVFRLKYFGFLAPAVALFVVHPGRGKKRQTAIYTLIAVLVVLSWIQRFLPVIVTRRFIFWF